MLPISLQLEMPTPRIGEKGAVVLSMKRQGGWLLIRFVLALYVYKVTRALKLRQACKPTVGEQPGAVARSQGLRDSREEMAWKDPAPSLPQEVSQDEL